MKKDQGVLEAIEDLLEECDEPDDLDLHVSDRSQDPAFKAALADAAARASMLSACVAERKNRRLSQAAIADIMGTTQSAISDIEGGVSDARVSTFQRYVRAMDCRLDFRVLRLDTGESLGSTFFSHDSDQTIAEWNGSVSGSSWKAGGVESLRLYAKPAMSDENDSFAPWVSSALLSRTRR